MKTRRGQRISFIYIIYDFTDNEDIDFYSQKSSS